MNAIERLVRSRFIANTALLPDEVMEHLSEALTVTRSRSASQQLQFIPTVRESTLTVSVREGLVREVLAFQVSLHRSHGRTIITSRVVSCPQVPIWPSWKPRGVLSYRTFCTELLRSLSTCDSTVVSDTRD